MSRTKTIWQLWAWSLFVVSALLFIASSLRSGDLLGLGGGIFFLLACIVGIVGLLPLEQNEAVASTCDPE